MLATVLFVASSGVTQAIINAFGADLRLEDTDAGVADTIALRTALMVVLVRQVLLVLGIWMLYRFLADGTTTFPLANCNWWKLEGRVVLCAAGIYAAVVAYAGLMSMLGVEWLTPQGTIGKEVTRDPLTLALAGVLALVVAPVSEELLFRGVIFSALTRLGVVFGAFTSGLIFALPHFDMGSLLPFTFVGVALAWVYYRRRSLSAAIHFHLLFNSISFFLLLAI